MSDKTDAPNKLASGQPADSMLADFIAAQSEMPEIPKNGTANYGKYATLPDVMSKIRPVLNRHRFAVLQFTDKEKDGSEPILVTQLRHLSGKVIASEMPLLLRSKDAQAQGSAITYARRYSLLAMLGLAPDDDDDGQAASNRNQGDASRQSPPKRPAFPTQAQITEIAGYLDALDASRETRDAVASRVKTAKYATAMIEELKKKVAAKQAAEASAESDDVQDTALADQRLAEAEKAVSEPEVVVDDAYKEAITNKLTTLKLSTLGMQRLIKAATDKLTLKLLDDAGWIKLNRELGRYLNNEIPVPDEWRSKAAPAENNTNEAGQVPGEE